MAAIAPDHLLLESMATLWFHQNVFFKPAPSPSTPANTTQITKTETTVPATAKKEAENDRVVGADQFVIVKHQLVRLSSLSPGAGERMRQLRRKEMMGSSCKSLSELEEEELKGCRDLGFSFKAEEVSSHVMQILPALQKLGVGEKRLVHRPYLSEAWLIKRPNSPLLNMRVPSSSGASMADVKRRLRCWARTVAAEVLM